MSSCLRDNGISCKFWCQKAGSENSSEIVQNALWLKKVLKPGASLLEYESQQGSTACYEIHDTEATGRLPCPRPYANNFSRRLMSRNFASACLRADVMRSGTSRTIRPAGGWLPSICWVDILSSKLFRQKNKTVLWLRSDATRVSIRRIWDLSTPYIMEVGQEQCWRSIGTIRDHVWKDGN